MLSASLNKTFPSFLRVVFSIYIYCYFPENIEQSCNEQQLEATRLNRAYIPQCTSDGLFEKVQCQCEGDRTDSGMPCEYIPSSCWCADVKYGQAINGTVQRSRSDMDCETGEYVTLKIIRNMWTMR